MLHRTHPSKPSQQSCLSFSRFRTSVMAILFAALSSFSFAQVTLSLDYQEKTNKTTIPAGDVYTMQLNYSISSTTSATVSGVKAVINLPDLVYGVEGFSGTVHAPNANFVYSGTPGAKKLTINFVNNVPTGSTGVIEFVIRSTNLITPNNTGLASNAELSDASGASSGVKNHSINVTAERKFCTFKWLTGGTSAALNNEATYRVMATYSTSRDYPNFTALGTLNFTNLTIVDTLPVGATFVSAKMYRFNYSVATFLGDATHAGGVVTASIPVSNNFTWSGGSATWFENFYYVDIVVRYDSPTFTAGQSVTNTAALNYTVLGQAPGSLTHGQNIYAQCNADLNETHTLESPVVTALLTKATGNTQVTPGSQIGYEIGFKNTGNVALENVEIIENIPPELVLDSNTSRGLRMDSAAAWLGHMEYQTNLNPSWTVYPKNVAAILPLLPAGEKFTKIKIVLAQPLLPNESLPQYTILYFRPASEVTQATNVTNCIEWHSTTAGIPTLAARTTCNSAVNLVPRPAYGKLWVNASHTPSCAAPVASGTEVSFRGDFVADEGFSDVLNPVVGFAAHPGFVLVPGSAVYTDFGTGLPTPTYTLLENFDGLGTNFYRWTFPAGSVMPRGTNFRISMRAIATNAVPPGVNVGPRVHIGGSGATITGSGSSQNAVDTFDLDNDGNTTETNFFMSTWHNSCSLSVSAAASMESVKWVKGLCDTDFSRFPDFGQTVPGGNADYKLIVSNTGNVPMKDIKIIDILPHVGDRGVVDPAARSSQWRPNLAGPISAPAGITVYYSTVPNPCRDEVKPPAEASPFPAGCAPANWSTTPPSDITKVYAVKIDFGATVLGGGESLEFSWPMRAPVNAPTNDEIAWNSFGFVATRTDTNQPLIAAEPPKVGIKVKPGAPAYYGNRVWFDTDRDGIQDPGEGGVDGVTVKLYSPVVAGVVNPAADTLINFTITGNGGLYRFSNLNPGEYYAIFCLPNGYTTSPKNAAGSTNENDSDGTNTTYDGLPATITISTTLVADEEDLTWDQGIYCNFIPEVTPIQTVELGDSVTLTAAGGTSFWWVGPNGFTSSSASITINPVTANEVGVYTVDIVDGECRATQVTEIALGSTPNCCPELIITIPD